MEILELCDSGITSLPSSIGQLQSLKELSLYHTEKLTNLPEEIGNLANLEILELGSSGIPNPALPSSIGQLQTLKKLSLINTKKLANLPSSFGLLENLEYLDLQLTSFTTLPESIERLKALRSLFITGSNFFLELSEDVRYEFISMLLKRHPFLGSIDVFDFKNNNKNFEYALACNRFRSKRTTRAPTATRFWWPLILEHAKSAFKSNLYDDNMVNAMRVVEIFDLRNIGLGEEDAIYRFMQDETDSFVEILVNRNKKPKN